MTSLSAKFYFEKILLHAFSRGTLFISATEASRTSSRTGKTDISGKPQSEALYQDKHGFSKRDH